MTEDRIEELKELVLRNLGVFITYEFFDYSWWDDLLEEEKLTYGEFRKLEDLFHIKVSVEENKPMP